MSPSIAARRAGLVALLGLLSGLAACHRGSEPLGPADSYLLFEPGPGGDAAAETASAKAPLPVKTVELDDPRAAPLHRGALEGFAGEMLRTDYLAKQLIRDGLHGKTFPEPARASAMEPTTLILAGSRTVPTAGARLGLGVTTKGFFGGAQPHPAVLWIEVGDDPPSDPAFVQTSAGRIARLVGERLVGAGGTTAVAPSLVLGYAWAMEVIGREWRVGEGPQGTIPPDAGTGTQRSRFAGVRENTYVLRDGDPQHLRPGAEMLTDPGVVATVLYRMAQSRGIGHRVAPAEVYAPFVTDRIPPGVSPAAVLGPVRNFQAKLLVAWGSAILAGKPPHDLAELIVAYAAAMPGERAEVLRVFVVTTYGATVKEGGVSPAAADANATLAELTALSAEVAAGRRTLRAAVP